ncbi:hypothetical protein ABBQ32_000770 [Trebouxia sp. C0010 RCD-2024]
MANSGKSLTPDKDPKTDIPNEVSQAWLPTCSVQAQEQEKDFQAEKARLALVEHALQQGAALTGGTKQLPSRKRRLQTSQKRLMKFMHSAKVLLDSIAPQLFTAQQPMHVFIVFGSTASRPSELYSLAFPATDQQLGATPQKAMDDLARRTIRTLVMNTQDMPEGKASAGSQDNLHWYQCKTVLKGLRSPGGGEGDRAG